MEVADIKDAVVFSYSTSAGCDIELSGIVERKEFGDV